MERASLFHAARKKHPNRLAKATGDKRHWQSRSTDVSITAGVRSILSLEDC